MILYRFQFQGGRQVDVKIDQDRKFTAELDGRPHPPWTRLEFQRCVNCPVEGLTTRHCPTAVDVADVVTTFADVSSADPVTVQVRTPARLFLRECDVQTGLNSLLGLLMATSACPILSRLRSLARFHLPFATFEETLYRTVGDYLVKQYLIQSEGGCPDFTLRGLESLYTELETVNRCFVRRLAEEARRDANLNVICNLSTLSTVIRFSIAEQLREFRELIAL